MRQVLRATDRPARAVIFLVPRLRTRPPDDIPLPRPHVRPTAGSGQAILPETNRTLEEALGEVQRLQDDLLTTERQAAAVAETISAATYEMERPLVSLSIYVDELLRKVGKDEEKVEERVGDMERVLREIRACCSAWARPRAAGRAGGQGQN